MTPATAQGRGRRRQAHAPRAAFRVVAEEGRRKRARDEEIVAIVIKILLREGTVATQARLARLANRELAKRGHHVTGERVRVLAARSGLVSLAIRARTDGPAGELRTCPVCRSKLERTENRTLTGKAAATGYKCTRCPWWTGRELRVPSRYVFQARVARGEADEEQLSFLARKGA
jgi:hypothetical protein